MKTLYLIRGIPGSGKSTLANSLTNYVFEADKYWSDDRPFNRSDLPKAHEFCGKACLDAMRDMVSPIAVANTFIKRWEMDAYYIIAEEFGYTVFEIISNYPGTSVHNVPHETVARMKANFEW